MREIYGEITSVIHMYMHTHKTMPPPTHTHRGGWKYPFCGHLNSAGVASTEALQSEGNLPSGHYNTYVQT